MSNSSLGHNACVPSNVVAMKLSYTTQRSTKRRKLTITVERDRSVVVHAPQGISDDKIQKVVESKRQWIHDKIKHPQKYQTLPHPPGKELVSGESALYLGRQYRIEIVKTGLSGIQFRKQFLIYEHKTPDSCLEM